MSAKVPRCRPALKVIPSMPASMAESSLVFKVPAGLFMVSFSMQLMNSIPEPRLASITEPTCNRVACPSASRSNLTSDLSALATLYLYFCSLSRTKLVRRSWSTTVGSMASDMWPIPPICAAVRASAVAEMSTPMPPVTMGRYSRVANLRRWLSSFFIMVCEAFRDDRSGRRELRFSGGLVRKSSHGVWLAPKRGAQGL